MTSDLDHLARKLTRGAPHNGSRARVITDLRGDVPAARPAPAQPRRGEAPTLRGLAASLAIAAALALAIAMILLALALAPRCRPGHELTIGGAIRIAGCQQGGRP